MMDKYLEGSLNSEECRLLNDWINADDRHQQQFIEYAKASGTVDRAGLQESWNELQRKILFRESLGSAEIPVQHRKGAGIRKLFRNVLKYAAVLLVGALGTFIIYQSVMNRGAEDETNWIVTQTVAGQKAKMVLPDNSVVWLNAETTLSFPPDYLTRKHREVKLKGEAYFDVTDQHRKTFTVVSDDYDIEVKGTKFNVMAYSDFDRTETTLVEGSIRIKKGDKSVFVEPGQRVIWDGSKLIRSTGLVRQATLWKDNKFYFDHISFKELVRRLERWYDVEITLLDESLNNENYSGYFKNEETIWQVLDVLKMTTPIKYERKEFREIVIDRK